MGIVQSFERGLGFWAEAAVAIGRTAPRTTRVTQQGDMGYGLQVTAPIEAGRNIAAYLLTSPSYIDPECAEPVVLTQSSIIDLTQHMRFKASQPTCIWTMKYMCTNKNNDELMW